MTQVELRYYESVPTMLKELANEVRSLSKEVADLREQLSKKE